MSDEAILYVIPGSHPARTGQLMLEHKGIPFRRVNLVPGFHRVYVRARGFPGDRVPAVKFPDGSRAQGTRPLARALDALNARAAARAGRPARGGGRALGRRRAAAVGAPDGDRGGHPRSRMRCTSTAAKAASGRSCSRRDRQRRVMARLVKIAYRMTSDQFRDDRTRTAEMLDRVDELIAAGRPERRAAPLRRPPDRDEPGAGRVPPGRARTAARPARGRADGAGAARTRAKPAPLRGPCGWGWSWLLLS